MCDLSSQLVLEKNGRFDGVYWKEKLTSNRKRKISMDTFRFELLCPCTMMHRNAYIPRIRQHQPVNFVWTRENAYRAGKDAGSQETVRYRPFPTLGFLSGKSTSTRRGKRRIVPLCKLISLPVNAPIFQTGTWSVRLLAWASVSWQQQGGEGRGRRGRKK